MAQPAPLDINILPERYRQGQVKPSVVIVTLVMAALLFGLAPAYVALTREQARTSDRQAHLDQIKANLTQSQVDQDQLAQLDEQIEETRAQVTQLHQELETIGKERPLRSAGITAIASALVPQIRIVTISQNGNFFTFKGTSDDPMLVLNYASALQSSGQFVNVRVLSIANADPPTVEFSIELEQ
jgi:Tfp pilus assembly protein PilN